MKSCVAGYCDKEAFHQLTAALLDATEHRDTGGNYHIDRTDG